MRIKELELIQPSKEVVEFFKNFMQEHNKGLKAIKTLAEIKEIAYDGYNNGQTSYATFQLDKIIDKINEVENVNNQR